ncbi:MAG: efflux RND transporter periplasmic adaptor subunit [Thermoanaerobaculia bacterium]
MKTKTRWLALVPLVALAALVLGVRIDRARARAETPAAGTPPRAVQTAVVAADRVERRLTVEARIQAAHAAQVAPEVTGRVLERLVEPGDAVRRGQELLRLEDATFTAEVARLEAELAAARARAASAAADEAFAATALGRERTLFAGGAVSREALDRAEVAREHSGAALEAAERQAAAVVAALRAARERLADTLVRAPWDGSVVSVDAMPGDLATAGRPLVRLVRDGPYRVVAHLPHAEAARLTTGSPVVVTHAGHELPARVSRVAAGLGPAGLALVEVDLPDRLPGMMDGASVRLSLVLGSAEGLTVPEAALLDAAGGTSVFRLETAADGSRVQPVRVDVRLRGSGRAVVEAVGAGGTRLAQGDRVVVEHPSVLMTLAPGMVVRPADPSDGSSSREGP